MKSWSAVRRQVDRLFREVAKFGVVGAVGMLVDLGAFNLLRYDLDGTGLLHDKPLTARALSIGLATVVTYVGNRLWTWRHRQRRAVLREYALFVGLNGVGLLINLAVLGLVNYVLLLDGPVPNNIASLVGIGLGTLFRFWSYRRFVFLEHPAPIRPTEQPADQPVAASSGG